MKVTLLVALAAFLGSSLAAPTPMPLAIRLSKRQEETKVVNPHVAYSAADQNIKATALRLEEGGPPNGAGTSEPSSPDVEMEKRGYFDNEDSPNVLEILSAALMDNSPLLSFGSTAEPGEENVEDMPCDHELSEREGEIAFQQVSMRKMSLPERFRRHGHKN